VSSGVIVIDGNLGEYEDEAGGEDDVEKCHPPTDPKVDDREGVDLTFVARAHRDDLDRQG
jgi:hypothetical protein